MASAIRFTGETADRVRIYFRDDGEIACGTSTVDRGRNVSLTACEALHADIAAWTWSTLPSAMKALRAAEKKGAADVATFRKALRVAPGRRMTADDAAECEARVQVASANGAAARRAHLDHCRRLNCPECA